ncbi:MAG: hypothetical protein IPJ30_00640 [Acidobacteria bacterium]|nr:hypothetical protein [Acidobacteriota bacterium]
MIKYSCLMVCVLAFGIATAIGKKPIGIEGTLVDQDGRPIADAYVRVVYDPTDDDGGSDGLVVVWRTFEDGYFGFETEWKPRKRIVLIIESKPAGDADSPIDGEKLFRNGLHPGIVIKRYQREVSLGKIRRFVRYERVRFDITDCGKSFLDNIRSRAYFLRIKDQRNRILAYSSIARSAIADNRFVQLNLPHGEWTVELVERETERVIVPSQKVRVVPSGNKDIKISAEYCKQAVN